MNTEIIATITGIITAVVSWILSKLMTKRERKKSDMEFVSSSVENLLLSIDKLTAQNTSLVNDLKSEQEKNLVLLKENNALLQDKINLSAKIEALSKKIDKQNKEIAELSALVKGKSNDEKNNIDNL